jgi:vacuolar-type H+-ATPase subunit E/Vma4
MEIVKTSEALESQILDDARVKARKVLESADKECVAVRAEWDRRNKEEADRLDAAREAQCAALRQELVSSLPLDFMRTRLSFIQEAVSTALKDLFDSLSPADLSRIIGARLAKAAFAFKGARVAVEFAGMDAELAKRIVRDSLPGVTVETVNPMDEELAAQAGKGVILRTADSARRYRGTLSELASLLLEEHREELVTALFGKDVAK